MKLLKFEQPLYYDKDGTTRFGIFDIDKLDIGILDGKTTLVESITASSDRIVVESVDSFLDNNGSILIGDEVIYYESTTDSPNLSLSPGVSYEEVKLKFIGLKNLIKELTLRVENIFGSQVNS